MGFLENVGLYIFEMCPSEEEKKATERRKKRDTENQQQKQQARTHFYTAHRRENVQSF
jgi:hypothetical protein